MFALGFSCGLPLRAMASPGCISKGLSTRRWGKNIFSMVFSSQASIAKDENPSPATSTGVLEEPLAIESQSDLVSSAELPSANDALAALFAQEESASLPSQPALQSSDIDKEPTNALQSIESFVENIVEVENPVETPKERAIESAIAIAPVEPNSNEVAPHLSVVDPVTRDGAEFQPTTDLTATDCEEIPTQVSEPGMSKTAGTEAAAENAATVLPAKAAPSPSQKSPSDWAFEEKLASHKEWVESQGASGKRADLANQRLEAGELIGVNLRFADLHDAKLRGTDLLLADLRDTSLIRADLQDSCLVGANLEGANLEGADLESSLGLVARQIAGTNLRDASIPAHILEFDAHRAFDRASRAAYHTFVVLMAVCSFCLVAIFLTKDAQLISDSGLFTWRRAHALSSALPTAEFYLLAPVLIFVLYFALHFHLQRLWDSVLELPAVFPDGSTLGESSPRVLSGLLRLHFRWMDQDAPSARQGEKIICAMLAYGTAPLVLLFLWARYLTLQDFHGTILQSILAAAAVGLFLYALLRSGRPPQRWTVERRASDRLIARVREMNVAVASAAFLAVLLTFSLGTIKGAPHDQSRAPQLSSFSIRRWIPTIFWTVGFDPYAKLPEAALSAMPDNWNASDEQAATVKGAQLNGRSIRYAQAYGAFFANAHLFRSSFQGAFLARADFRNADLGQSDLRMADLDSAHLAHATLDRADLQGANLARSDSRNADLSYSILDRASLVDGQFTGASLYNAHLNFADLTRVNLEKADIRSAQLEGANFEHADLQQAYFWSAKLTNAHLRYAQLQNAIFIDADLQGADLGGAQMQGTVLNEANLAGANLAGADMRGVLGLTVGQVCSTKHWQGAIFDDAMQTQINTACPALR